MPQRVSDEEVARFASSSESHMTGYEVNLALDLRDARAEIAELEADRKRIYGMYVETYARLGEAVALLREAPNLSWGEADKWLTANAPEETKP